MTEDTPEYRAIKTLIYRNFAKETDRLLVEIYTEIASKQRDVICSPIRFNGVSIEDIAAIFEQYGIDVKPKF